MGPLLRLAGSPLACCNLFARGKRIIDAQVIQATSPEQAMSLLRAISRLLTNGSVRFSG